MGEWQHFPVQVRLGPSCRCPCCAATLLPVNSPHGVGFETSLFKGEVICCVKGAAGGADPWADGQRFNTDTRKMSLTIRGRFKEDIPADDVVCGMAWREGLANLPWGFVLKSAESLMTVLSPGATASLTGESPHLMNSMLKGVDALCDKATHPAEYVRDTPTARTASTFHAHTTYTFDFWSDKIDLHAFSAVIPGLPQIALAKYLNGQGFPFVARTRDGRVLWEFEIFHESLFPGGVSGEGEYLHAVEDFVQYMEARGEEEGEGTRTDTTEGGKDTTQEPFARQPDDEELLLAAAQFYASKPSHPHPLPRHLRLTLASIALVILATVCCFYPTITCNAKDNSLLNKGICLSAAAGVGLLFF